MVVPGYRTFDGPSFTAAVVFSMLMFAVASRFGLGALLLLLLGLEHTLQMVLTIYWFAILIVIVLSFLAPMTTHPAALLARQVVEPVLAPARRLLPPFSGLDLSPLLVFFAIFAARELLAAFFQTLRAAML
jgi:YggT family protein